MENDAKLYNYDLIHMFNEMAYKDMLFANHISGNEVHIEKAKDIDGDEILLNYHCYPLHKDRKAYLMRSDDIKLLPRIPLEVDKISVDKKVYYLVRNSRPAGFGPHKMFASFREFVDQFCPYSHTNSKDFLLWKLVSLTSYFKRINVRVCTPPSFGKDSILRVLNGLGGEIGIVHNPTIAKIEWLLTNKVLMTNEVANIKAEDTSNLEQYYLTCGDFGNVYEKRSRSTMKGSHERYDISKLSNLVCYNDLDCYPEKKRDKYFDFVFQRAVRERFMPFRFTGKIVESEAFGAVLHPEEVVKENIDFYKNNIKMMKYMTTHFDDEVHGWEVKDFGFTDSRSKRNWETICLTLDIYSQTQEEYDSLTQYLFERMQDYHNHIEEVQTGSYKKQEDVVIATEEEINRRTPDKPKVSYETVKNNKTLSLIDEDII